MNPLFHIVPAEMLPAQTYLFVELSKGWLSFFYQDTHRKMITGLSVFNLDQKIEAYKGIDSIKRIFTEHELLNRGFKKTYIIHADPESILTPAACYDKKLSDHYLNVVHGDLRPGIIFSDHLEERNIYNVYRVPDYIDDIITETGEPVIRLHQYSLLLKGVESQNDLLKIIIYPSKVVILLQMAGKLRVVESFSYVSAGDVLYHMLNVCAQFNANEVAVEIGGIAEKDSALIKEMNKYFVHIRFSALPSELSYAAEIKNFPAYFFSHLFAYSVCV